MGFNIASVSGPLGTKLATLTPVDNSAEEDIFGGAVTVYAIEVNNTLNANQINYVKLIDGDGSGAQGVVTEGTDAPHHILYAPAGKRITYMYPEGMPFSKVRVWATQEPGTAGTTSPSSSVTVEILAT